METNRIISRQQYFINVDIEIETNARKKIYKKIREIENKIIHNQNNYCSTSYDI